MDKNGFSEKTIVIPVEEWHALGLDGAAVKAVIRLAGHSMQPLIRKNRDFVTVQPIKRRILKGDIVLFRNADGRYIVHRVRKTNGDKIQTMGDSCAEPDREISAAEVLGYVTHICRKNRTILVDTPVWRLAGRFWLAVNPLRKIIRFVFRPFKRMLGRLVR